MMNVDALILAETEISTSRNQPLQGIDQCFALLGRCLAHTES
jgi:hypothetical protein